MHLNELQAKYTHYYRAVKLILVAVSLAMQSKLLDSTPRSASGQDLASHVLDRLNADGRPNSGRGVEKCSVNAG
jgi:hypothetical protein